MYAGCHVVRKQFSYCVQSVQKLSRRGRRASSRKCMRCSSAAHLDTATNDDSISLSSFGLSITHNFLSFLHAFVFCKQLRLS